MRYLDLIMNPHVKNKFVIRSKLVTFLRRYLDNMGFLEVGLVSCHHVKPWSPGDQVDQEWINRF